MGNERIQKFTPDGQFVIQWEIESDVSFYSGIAVDISGFVYVTDAASHCIRKFTSDGQVVAKWGSNGKEDGEFEAPYGLMLDDRGFAYVADTGNNRIQKFTVEGQFMTKWGSGLRGGDVQNPYGIAVDSSDFR